MELTNKIQGSFKKGYSFVKDHSFTFLFGIIGLFALITFIIILTGDKRLLGENLDIYLRNKTNSLFDCINANKGSLFVSQTTLWVLVRIFNENGVLYYLFNILLLVGISVSVFVVFRKIKEGTRNYICALLVFLLLVFNHSIYNLQAIHFYIGTLLACWSIYFFHTFINNQNIKHLIIFSGFVLLTCMNVFAPIILLPFCLLFFIKTQNKKLSIIYSISLALLMICLSYGLVLTNIGGFGQYYANLVTLIFKSIGIPFDYDGSSAINIGTINPILGAFSIIASLLFLNQLLMSMYSLILECKKSFKNNPIKWISIYSYIILMVIVGPFLNAYSVCSLMLFDFVLLLFINQFYNQKDYSSLKKHNTSIIAAALSIPMVIVSFGLSLHTKNVVIKNEAISFDLRQQQINSLSGNSVIYGNSDNCMLFNYHLSKTNNSEAASIKVVNDNGVSPTISKEDFENKDVYYASDKALHKVNNGISITDTWLEGVVFESFFYTEQPSIGFMYYIPDFFPVNSMNVYIADTLVFTDNDFNGIKATDLPLPEGAGHIVHLKIVCDHTVLVNDMIPGSGDLRHVSITIVHLDA